MGWACGTSGAIRFFGNRFEVKIIIFESDMSGAIKTDLDIDSIFGSNAEGLVWEQLKEKVLTS